ncbi:MAG: DNA double-strand break repair nuclease NurA [Spirulina sp. SIO3F2]|nr:DNA double-strand break repair nuclease NurA [Spirulina sp. SIO3F2]
MGKTSRSRKPDEWAAKINHTRLIKDPFIQNFIKECRFPKDSSEIDSQDTELIFDLIEPQVNPIKYIISVDGGYTTVEVKKNFPSSKIAFFQFGALLFDLKDLEDLSEKPFIFPEDINKLHNLKPFKLALHVQNVISKTQSSLQDSIRREIYEFFLCDRDSSTFMETLAWLTFREYNVSSPVACYRLGTDPYTGSAVELYRNQMNSDYTFDLPQGKIFLTDIFRLHEVIDEDHGAGGILGYITRLIEQLIIAHFIRFLYRYQKEYLGSFLFIVDGPLSFSGQTANMHILMRDLCNFLLKGQNLFLVGLEKSGAFVDHAQAICIQNEKTEILKRNQCLVLKNSYIYKYITPGDPVNSHYGITSYYGGKVIFHSSDGQIYVLSVPVEDKDIVLNPTKKDYQNLDIILHNIQKLKCDLYDDSIIPITLANKLVSLANNPSQTFLEKFVSQNIKEPS